MPVVEYAFLPGGSRRRSMTIDGITVMIEPHVDDVAARRLAEELHGYRAAVTEMAAELADLRRRVPPARRNRLFGAATVRFLNGKVFLLNKREGKTSEGFGEFGFEFDGWDSLFRAWDVVVTDHGQDKHGCWWEVQNAVGV